MPSQPIPEPAFCLHHAPTPLACSGLRLWGLIAWLGLVWLAGCQTAGPEATRTQPATLSRLPTPTLATAPTPAPTALPPPSPTPEPPTPTPLPTATLPPSQQWDLAQTAFDEGDYATVIAQLEAYSANAQAATPIAVRRLLARAYSLNAQWPQAIEHWLRLLTLAPEEADTLFFLAEAYRAQANCERALPNYRDFLQARPTLAAYIQPRIAECRLALGEREEARLAYAAADQAEAHYLTIYANRVALADLYMADGDYLEAAELYAKIRDAAQTPFTRGEMTYQAGNALILAGNTQEGYAEYRRAVQDYPDLNTSYLALLSLVAAQVAVDDYQRGLVDYYAQAYAPAVEAFERYLAANPTSFRSDARLYLGRSYAGMGQVDQALAQFEQYAEIDAGAAPVGWLAMAELLARQGRAAEAIERYSRIVAEYPGHARAAEAALARARLAATEGDTAQAVTFYQLAAEQFPSAESAPEALFIAGRLAWNRQDRDRAIQLWQRAAENYPQAPYGQAALLWWNRAQPETQAARPLPPLRSSYYNLRLHHQQAGVTPFPPPQAINLGNSRVQDQAGAEAWLRQRLNVAAGTEVGVLSAEIAADPRLVRGAQLWHLGLQTEAGRELDAFRAAYRQNPLVSYQLALVFRDLGLYRLSIVAAATLLGLTNTDPLDAPPFLGSLVYPVYYADLILPLAAEYNYDPLLQFALVRQESLFESFATSSAVAQGLAQVIPSTGEYIAGRLGHSDFDNSDLYRPIVGLRFGAYYLFEQLQTFDGYAPAALAAYNAGPGNAARWYRAAGDDLDEFIEAITFNETRLYVERIYVGHSIYRALYGN